jgi:hypothetical protein
MKCTWKDCNNEAKHSQISKDNREWANLCYEHNTKFLKDIKEGNVKAILSDWVKANGGSEALAKKM